MVEQGTAEWHALRCGKVTASRVADIIRRTKSGVSASRQRYLGELVAERLTGLQDAGYCSPDMQAGKEREAEAFAAYAFIRNADLQAVPFVDHPSIYMAGASPDRLVGQIGLVEAKCPANHTHIETLRGAPIPPDYITQVQWQLACTDRAWCDWISYCPAMPEDMRLHIVRVERDAKRISELETAVREFLAEVDEAIADLCKRYRQEDAA